MTSRRTLLTVFALLFAFTGFGLRRADARTDTRRGATPPRVRFIDGAVSFWRTGAEDWGEAQVNTALAAGDSLYAGDSANFEVQFGTRAFIRAAADTEIDLTTLDPDYLQFRITGGHAALDLERLPSGQTIEIDTPNAAFTVDRPGYYRLDVDENRTAFSAHRGGIATVVPAAGETTDVSDNQQILLEGTETAQVNVIAAPALDEWDRWNDARTAQLAEVPRSAQYVPPDIAGVDDLDRYGEWREQPRYGHVWVPRDVRDDWAPYSTGRWVYDPYYEWTWVDEAPWGWAPYHYGRWVHVDGYWGWAPGPVVVAPVYSPALVAFFGAPGVGVSVSVGLPFVSWVALGFGEPIVPWWGHQGFIGRPYWGGWGGPRVVNNVVINNTTIVNVRNINRFQNADVGNAVVAVDRRQFGRGRMEHIRLDAGRVRGLQPVRGDLRVRPVAASLVPREGRGKRPPERLQERQVVARRRPEDPMNRLRTKGVETTALVKRPEPRIVQPQRGAGGPGARPHGGGVGAESPATAGRQQPPPAPGMARPGGRAAERPRRPVGMERPQPGAPGALQGGAKPPPPPRGARSREQPAGRVEQASPPVPGQRSGNVGAGRPERPSRPHAAPQERVAPPPPARPQAAPQERVAPPPARPHAAPRERAAPPPPARPQVAPQERVAPQPPSRRPHAAPQERVVPQAPSRPQAAPRERVVPQQPARPQAAPRERVVPQQAAPPQAAPRERVVPQQPARPQAAPRERVAPQPQQQAPRPQAAPRERVAPQPQQQAPRPQAAPRAVQQPPARGRGDDRKKPHDGQ